jgi:type IV pilus assembly protein PilA
MSLQRKDKTMRSRQKGFSLIELLIVVAIILIIAAIAIPNFLASRMAANESSAVQETRAITTAEVVYNTQYGIGYSVALADLGDAGGQTATSTNAALIDAVLAAGSKAGYTFVYVPLFPDGVGHFTTYTINANPKTFGSTGRRYFFADQTAVIRQNYTAAASAGDPAI